MSAAKNRSLDVTRRPRPAEPPTTGYTRTTARRLRVNPAVVVPSAVTVLIAVTATYVVLQDSPARGAADHAAVVVTPTSTTGTTLPRKGTEYAPPVPDSIPGDGTWLVGKQVKPGIYQSNAGPLCYWERLAGLSGEYVDLIDNGGFRKGPTLVEIKETDFAFGSQGCARWDLVR